MNEAEEPLSPAEAERLRVLRRTPVAPPEAVERTVDELAARGLLARRGKRGLALAPLAAAAGLAAAFFLGRATGEAGARPSAGEHVAAGPRWLLVVRDDAGPPLAGEALEARVAEYGAWARGLGERLVDAAHLDDATRLLRRRDGALDVERGDALASLGGYFLFTAPDEPTALELAAGCPHLDHGGTLELRRLDEGQQDGGGHGG